MRRIGDPDICREVGQLPRARMTVADSTWGSLPEAKAPMSEFLGEDPDRFWADTMDGQQISGRQGEKLSYLVMPFTASSRRTTLPSDDGNSDSSVISVTIPSERRQRTSSAQHGPSAPA